MTKTFTDPPEERVVLKYRLKGDSETIADWGHEYLRFLAGEVAKEWNFRDENAETEDVPNVEELRPLSDQIMKYMMNHQDESTACDLAMETNNAKFILNYCDESNHLRVAQYVVAVAEFLVAPEDTEALTVAYEIYAKFKAYAAALRIAISLADTEKVKALFSACEDEPTKIQMALICGRYRLFLDHDDSTLEDYNSNTKLSEFYLAAAKELDTLAPKKVEDIYKNHLVDSAVVTNSYVSNLATTFVSAFANAGYGKDELLDKDNTWIFQNKEHRMMSAAASLGLVHLWDHEGGLTAVDRYSYSEEPLVRAGVALANGIVMCGVKSPFDPALGLLLDKIMDPHRETRIGAILGLGYAYAGTNKADIKEALMPLVADGDQPTDVQAFAAYAMALVFPGTCDEDISEAIVSSLMEKSDQQLTDVTIRYMILALGCLFLSTQEKADTLIEATQALSPIVQKYAEIVVGSCAYAGSGNVMQIQKLFSIIAEQADDDDDEEEAKKPEEETDAVEAKPLNHKAVAVLGISLIAMGERLGTDMCKRSLIHILMADHVKKGDTFSGRAALPLAYALLSPSEPNMQIIEILHKLSHDGDVHTATNAILAMGVVSAGSGNARVASMLRGLSSYYHKDKDANVLFVVRIAQGLTALGKGNLTINPLQSDNQLLCPSALVGVLGLLHSALDIDKTILDSYHYMLYSIVPAISPRTLLTINPQGEVVKAQARVGIPVDTVAVPGKPRAVTGFQTQATPLVLSALDRAEIIGKHQALTPVIEGIIVVVEKEDKAE
eukprot:GILI01003759.1.p1 GENE.GILI01003759.1~~GILI01003759.1.p1  ORF type:complete len:814 (+),score=269.78 GILI01003759.1:102-2444(+)